MLHVLDRVSTQRETASDSTSPLTAAAVTNHQTADCHFSVRVCKNLHTVRLTGAPHTPPEGKMLS